MSLVDREKLRARLRALLAKTTDAGCSEAEAIAAAEKAAELMRDYALTHDDVYMTEKVIPAPQKLEGKALIIGVIAIATNSAIVHTAKSGKASIFTVYGFEPGPDIAEYLYTVCSRLIEQELALFRRSEFYRRRRSAATRRKASADFVDGMVMRLADKVMELFEDNRDGDKTKAAKKAADAAFPNAKAHRAKPQKTRFDEALASGWDAADSTDLRFAVRGRKPVARIGGGS